MIEINCRKVRIKYRRVGLNGFERYDIYSLYVSVSTSLVGRNIVSRGSILFRDAEHDFSPPEIDSILGSSGVESAA